MKKLIAFFCLLLALPVVSAAQSKSANPRTFCNPLDLDYRFALTDPSHRTAADPLIVLYKDEYYLFASKSGGYWHSPDLRDWTLVVPRGLPLEDYAPSVMVMGGKMYYTAHRDKLLFETEDPKKGDWTKTADIGEYADPMLFPDDDGRVYMYFGSSLDGGISAVELDPKQNFREISPRVQLMKANSAALGWEGSGEDNLGYVRSGVNRVEPYIEGAWMTKHNGVYYLQYAAPGTIWKTYGDGVYTSKYPDRDFVYQPYSPFSYKPGGFIGGAGHSGTFRDKQGNFWRVTTMIVSVKHKFERRLGIFPAGFGPDGEMRMNTYLGDYPQFVPGTVKNPLENNLAGWMLLTFGKRAEASSALEGAPAENAFDEDIRTVWSAKTAERGEFLTVDLGVNSKIHAVQINFGEQDTTAKGRGPDIYQQYVLEISADGRDWKTLADKSRDTRDAPHEYLELEKPATARFVRITNVRAAGGGKFSVRDLRVFGRSAVAKPAEVKTIKVSRKPEDGRKGVIEWATSAGAAGYTVRWGVAAGKLHGSFQVVRGSSLVMNWLDKNADYYFSVDAHNEGGVARGRAVVKAGR